MSFLALLKAKLRWLLSGTRAEQASRKQANDAESGNSSDRSPYPGRNFERDYNAASALLKERMNENYPDNYHARLSSKGNNAYDHGEERAYAVDTASAAIALALRNGATVREAADAGAASIGI
jgi:hypothetical protein